MCSGFIAAATDTGKTVLKKQTADGLYYAVRYLSYMASATVRPEQEALPGESCSYQRDQKQPDGRKSHEHLLIFNHLFSLRYIIYPSIYYHLFPSVFITLKICCRNRITVSHKVHCNGSGLNKMTKVGMSESVPRTGD